MILTVRSGLWAPRCCGGAEFVQKAERVWKQDMILARHAEALLWTGRYLERAESTSRCLDYAANSITGLRADEAIAESELLVKTLGLSEELQEIGPLDSRPQLVAFLLSDRDNPGSMVSSIIAVRENLRSVRDRIPIELWEEANGLYLRFPFLGHDNTPSDLHEVLLMVRRACLAISGVLNEGMEWPRWTPRW